MNLKMNKLRVDTGSGPGSRGGHVIGRTTSGKPIYASASHHGHAKFTASEHRHAAALHDKEAQNAHEALSTIMPKGPVNEHTQQTAAKAFGTIEGMIHNHKTQRDAHQKMSEAKSKKYAEIRQHDKDLRSKSSSELKKHSALPRVFDSRGLSKGDLVSHILHHSHKSHDVEAAFDKKAQ